MVRGFLVVVVNGPEDIATETDRLPHDEVGAFFFRAGHPSERIPTPDCSGTHPRRKDPPGASSS